MTRIGPRMQAVADYVARHPGCPKLWPADHVAPNGRGRQYGYRSVDRAIAAGLIRCECVHANRYALFPIYEDGRHDR